MDEKYSIGYEPLFTFHSSAFSDTPHSDALAGVSCVLSALSSAISESSLNERSLCFAFDVLKGVVDSIRESMNAVEVRVFSESGGEGDE